MTTAPTANFNDEHRSSKAAAQDHKAVAIAMLANFCRLDDIAYLMIKHVDDSNFPGSDKLCGYFDYEHFPEMIDIAFRYSGCCESVFLAINELNPIALFKCANQIGPALPSVALSNADINRRTKLLIDIDPKRSIGGACCATNKEQQEAGCVSEQICTFLEEQGITVAMTCCSGNGYHHYINIDLAPESDLPKRFLRILASKFNTEAVEVDLQVSSACQLTRFYGTRVCKGQDLPDRPHRDSFVIDAVTNSETIGSNALEQFVDRHETPLTTAISTGQLNPDVTAKVKRARSYVEKMKPAISGDGGHNQTFTVACSLVLGFDFSISDALPIMRDYNQRCKPPWTEEELRHKLVGADAIDDPRGYLLTNLPAAASTTTTRRSSVPSPQILEPETILESASLSVTSESVFPGHVPDFVLAPVEKIFKYLTAEQALPGRGHPKFDHTFQWQMQILNALYAQQISPVVIPDTLVGMGIGGINQPRGWRQRCKYKDKNELTTEKKIKVQAAWLNDHEGQIRAQIATEECGADLDTKFLDLYEGKTNRLVELKSKLFCTSQCPLHGSSIRHEHYRFFVRGPYWLGAYEPLVTSRSDREILLDFDKLDDDGKPHLKRLVKDNWLFHVYMPVQLFGQACGLTIRQIRAFQGIMRERTRGIPRGVESCLTRKALVENATVPGKRGRGSLRCPLLEPEVQYVAFGGNIKSNFGRGYQVVGALTATSLGGWVRRLGYPVRKEDGDESIWRCVMAMFSDLKKLSNEFKLVVAFLGADSKWEDLDTAIEIARSSRRGWLNKATMRIFVPADYLKVWRSWFARKLGFSYIPGGEQSQPPVCSPVGEMSKERAIAILKRTGITRKQLAARIRCDASTVGRQISGKSKMSKPLLLELLSLDKLEVAK